MSPTYELTIERLNRTHDRAAFDCGIESLNRYLKSQANQDSKRRVSHVYIARDPSNKTTILGYYTLSTLSIDLSTLPEKLSKKLPRHPIPAALIGRLAVDSATQGRGIGKMLLADAINRTLAVSSEIALYATVVDALNPDAESFYLHYGFSLLTDTRKRLFLPLKSFD